MATQTTITATVTAATKAIAVTGDTVGYREVVEITLAGLPGGTDPTNLVLSLLYRNVELVTVDDFSAGGVAEMDLDDVDLDRYFAGLSFRALRTFEMTIWDAVEDNLIGNGELDIMNNPYRRYME